MTPDRGRPQLLQQDRGGLIANERTRWALWLAVRLLIFAQRQFCRRMFTPPSEKQKRRRKRHLNNSQLVLSWVGLTASCMRAFGLQVLLSDPGFRTAALMWPVLSQLGREGAEVVVCNDKKHMKWLTHESNLEQFVFFLRSNLPPLAGDLFSRCLTVWYLDCCHCELAQLSVTSA